MTKDFLDQIAAEASAEVRRCVAKRIRPEVHPVAERIICACGQKTERPLGLARKTRAGLEFLSPTERRLPDAPMIYLDSQVSRCESCHPRTLARQISTILVQDLPDPETRRLVLEILK